MRIVVAENIGFCFGVKRALEAVAEELGRGERIYLLGDLVHNSNVMNQLKQKGVEVVSLESLPNDSKDSVLIIRAHGIPPEDYCAVEKSFKRVIDTTCPIVRRLFQLVQQMRNEGYRIAVYGKKDHPEMITLKGYVKDAEVGDTPMRLSGKICLVSQTTMSVEDLIEFAGETLRISDATEFRFFNTICHVTARREVETRKIASQSDLVVVVGGKHSSNTKKLVSIAKKYCEVVHVEVPEEVDSLDLEEFNTIGVVSGTSTPYEDVKKIIEKLLSRRE